MPDIKTALSTALTEWEQDDKQQEKQMQKTPYVPHFKVTNNVTRATFDFVKNNPHQSCKTICAALEKDGYKPSSIGSLLTQFVKNGLCARDANNNYTTIAKEYSPIKVRKQLKAKQVIAKAKATRGEGIAALSPQPTPKAVPKTDIQSILNGLSILQARALYDELKKIFGG
jgi:hypothetical protein